MEPFSTLKEAIAQLEITVADDALEAVSVHLSLLRRWAKKMNLVSKGDLPYAETRHAADSLSLLRLQTLRSVAGNVIDVGSGAGFPGIPLAAARRDLQFTLLEPREKRGVFLTQVIAQAGLQHVVWHKGRVPEPALNGKFELVVSRATFPPEIIFDQVSPLLATNGIAVFMTSAPTNMAATANVIEEDSFRLGEHVRYLTAVQRSK
jgi:16S rRNA (guanine527-N7)-methyltransferase